MVNNTQPNKENTHIIAQITLSYSNFTLDVDLILPSKGISVIFGASGCGKTTLLRCIAGLEKTEGSRVEVNGVSWQTNKQFIKTDKRSLGFVFQEASLLDHLSVEANLNYGRDRSISPASAQEFTNLIRLLGIEHLLEANPISLSGGERQRVAIGCALMQKPKLLLMDEPLASLDDKHKQEILGYLEKLASALSLPIIYVTHSVSEATRLADYLVVLEKGKVKSAEIFQPEMAVVELCSNSVNNPFSIFFGRVSVACDDYHITRVIVGENEFMMPYQSVENQQKIRLHIDAKDVSLNRELPDLTSILNIFICKIVSIDEITEDGRVLIILALGDEKLKSLISYFSYKHLSLNVGEEIYAQIKAVSIVR